MAGRNDEVTIKITVGDINQLMMLAEEGFKTIISKIGRQVSEQLQPDSELRTRPVAVD